MDWPTCTNCAAESDATNTMPTATCWSIPEPVSLPTPPADCGPSKSSVTWEPGFAISMRDLEIRGAGNLLGTQQSGHIAAVGYEFYCQLLEAAVRRLKQLPPAVSIDVNVNLPGTAFFPSDYVEDLRFKIDLYRRLVRVAGIDQLEEYRQELVDRFGPPPPPVQRILEIAELRIDAAVWQISAIYVEEEYLVFRFGDRRRIQQLARLGGGRLGSSTTPVPICLLRQELTDPDAILALAKSVLRPVP